ncbi:50S ribosomal protein L5 [Candidatus Woesebacteria bacterium]|nr:50S ribosomal protein L5 [Candidatus Woesebacteria bacterium]MCD8507633.1 50S ribosomal protein L5 [Candidatus Woesebacteria bacterium]MCD8526781.1 50S ribosomal protein L5 [Candidatus Woesebacteria bacterium]MCD8546473.1 50S ribosomal protein L5 [Candidatus Woesebacteria bacterium]
MNRKKQLYQDKVVALLQEKFGKENALAVAKLTKIVVNVGIGTEPQGEKAVEPVVEQIAAITGQKPQPTQVRVSIAGFKIRAGDPVGVAVTLRGERMWAFFDKLVTVVLPQLKDFSGVSRTAFDQVGNYSLGLREQIVFPEIDYDKIDRVRGLQITMTVENSSGQEESFALLEALGMPFAKEE